MIELSIVHATALSLTFFILVIDLLWVGIGQPLRHALRDFLLPARFWPMLPDYLRPAWLSNIPGNALAIDALNMGCIAPFP